MRPSLPSLRLEAAKLRRVHNGHRGALLAFSELTEQEKQFLLDELTKDATVRRLNVADPDNECMFDKMMLSILNDYGVMCPHPRSSITETRLGYFCNNCECDLVPVKKAARSVVK